MLYAVRGAELALADPGGCREETTVFDVPRITIRGNTERPVPVNIGTIYSVGTDPKKIQAAADEILSREDKKGVVPPL